MVVQGFHRTSTAAYWGVRVRASMLAHRDVLLVLFVPLGVVGVTIILCAGSAPSVLHAAAASTQHTCCARSIRARERECVCVCACVNVCLGACGVCCFRSIPVPLVLRGSAHVCGWPAGHNVNTNVTAVCAWLCWCVLLEAGMTTSSHAQAASVVVCDQLSLSVCVGCTYKHRVCDSTAAPVCPQADCGVLHSLPSLHSYQQQTPANACLLHPRTTLGIWYVGLLCIWQQRCVAVGLLLG